MRSFFRSSRASSDRQGGPAAPPPLDAERAPPHRIAGETSSTAALHEELVTHWPALCRSAKKLMRDAADAEDLAHDTFERALRALGRFAPGTNMRAWLYTIMVRLARDQFRRRRARRTGEIDVEAVPSPEQEPPPPAWCAITPEQIRAALAGLSPILREVFELHELDHLAYLQIALRLDIPINTVASRLRRARERLRDVLLEPVLERETS
jgi:RNA polymerase sigma-70 factor (ECF subfamily)